MLLKEKNSLAESIEMFRKYVCEQSLQHSGDGRPQQGEKKNDKGSGGGKKSFLLDPRNERFGSVIHPQDDKGIQVPSAGIGTQNTHRIRNANFGDRLTPPWRKRRWVLCREKKEHTTDLGVRSTPRWGLKKWKGGRESTSDAECGSTNRRGPAVGVVFFNYFYFSLSVGQPERWGPVSGLTAGLEGRTTDQGCAGRKWIFEGGHRHWEFVKDTSIVDNVGGVIATSLKTSSIPDLGSS